MEKTVINHENQQNIAKIRHYFASANSGAGFDNLFGQINDSDKMGFLYILKGGPGTGKSTLMKTIGKTFFEMGENIEYFYCSSDYSSLDGVRLPRLNIAVVDGTAPHVTESQMAGVRDIIVNLGEFILPEIKKHESEIAAFLKKKKDFFEIAYKYIKTSASLYESNDMIYSGTKIPNIKSAAKKTIEFLDSGKKSTKEICKIRRLYLTAVADGGIISKQANNKYSTVVTLSYNNFVNNKILEEVSKLLLERGSSITCFCDLLSPKNISAIYLPNANALISKSFIPSFFACGNKELDKYLEFNNQTITKLLENASHALAAAKKQHKKVESFYIPNMDFAAIDKVTKALIDEIKVTVKQS